MKRFTLYAAKYEADLRKFAEKAKASKIIYIEKSGKINSGYMLRFVLTAGNTFCEQLMALLMDIAENENPMYANSTKLRNMARDLRSAPVFAHELRLLEEFIANENELNIEGYVTFRMCEFREKLDLMVYSLVKKIKFRK